MRGCLRSQRSTLTRRTMCLTLASVSFSLRNNLIKIKFLMILNDLTLYSWKMRTIMKTMWTRHTWFSSKSIRRDTISLLKTINREARSIPHRKKWKMLTISKRAFSFVSVFCKD
jgi:hypothetical protein